MTVAVHSLEMKFMFISLLVVYYSN